MRGSCFVVVASLCGCFVPADIESLQLRCASDADCPGAPSTRAAISCSSSAAACCAWRATARA